MYIQQEDIVKCRHYSSHPTSEILSDSLPTVHILPNLT